MDLKEIGWDGVHWVHVAQDRDPWRGFVNTVMNLGVSNKDTGILGHLGDYQLLKKDPDPRSSFS